jgi:histidine ammonia-lyase
MVEFELNAVTDNPLVFPETDTILNSGNFHGQSLAMAFDVLGLLLAEASIYSEARIDKLLSSYNEDLPLFLASEPGVNSGLMVTQYTANALVAHNRVLGNPAGLGNASVSAGQEDHASLGVTAALKAREILDNTTKVIAIELICATQAIDLLNKEPSRRGGAHSKMAEGTRGAYEQIRKVTKKVKEDRSLSEDIEKLSKTLGEGTIRNEAYKRARIQL